MKNTLRDIAKAAGFGTVSFDGKEHIYFNSYPIEHLLAKFAELLQANRGNAVDVEEALEEWIKSDDGKEANSWNNSISYTADANFKAGFKAGRASLANKPEHASDCAVHNMPAYPNGECDCKCKIPDELTFDDAPRDLNSEESFGYVNGWNDCLHKQRIIMSDITFEEELTEFENAAKQDAWVQKLGVRFDRDETDTYPYKYDHANLLFSIWNASKENELRAIIEQDNVEPVANFEKIQKD